MIVQTTLHWASAVPTVHRQAIWVRCWLCCCMLCHASPCLPPAPSPRCCLHSTASARGPSTALSTAGPEVCVQRTKLCAGPLQLSCYTCSEIWFEDLLATDLDGAQALAGPC